MFACTGGTPLAVVSVPRGPLYLDFFSRGRNRNFVRVFERPFPPSPAPFITPGIPPGRLSGTSGFPGDFELKSY